MIIRRNIYKNIYCSETIRRNPFSSWCDKFAQLVSDVMNINQLVCGIKYRENRFFFFIFTQNLFVYFHLFTKPIHKYEKLLKAFFNALNRLEEYQNYYILYGFFPSFLNVCPDFFKP